MIRYLLLIVFTTMLAGRALGLDLSLAPGLSVKNALLYLSAVVIAIESGVARNRKIELLSVITPFALAFFFALFSWTVVLLLLEYSFYSPRATLIRMKGKVFDQLLMLLVFFYGVRNLKDALWMIRALVWIITVGNLITVIDTFNIPNLGIISARDTDGRVEGFTDSAQDYGALLAFSLPMTVAVWWTETGRLRAIALFGIGLSLMGLLLAASRGAIFGLLVGGMLAAFLLRHVLSTRLLIRVSILALALSMAVVTVLLVSDFGEILASRMTKGVGSSDLRTLTSGRSENWSNILGQMMANPLTFVTGFGWEVFYEREGHRHGTHSVYIDQLYSLGFVGLLLYIAPFISSINLARRTVKEAAPEVVPYLIALVVSLPSLMIAMAFSNVYMAAVYAWAMTGTVLRLAVVGQEHSPKGYARAPSTVRYSRKSIES